MSAIHPEDFLRFFEEADGIQFMDAITGKSALEVLRERNHSKPAKKSDFDLWLEVTKLEQKIGTL